KNMCVRKFIPIVSDAAVAALCTFMLAFTFVRYHFGNTYGLIAALPAALAAGTLVFLYKGRKRKRALDTAAMSAGAEKLAAHLALLGPEESAALFARGLDGAKPDGSVAETDRGLYFCSFTPEPADRNALLTAIRHRTEKKKHFVCCTATQECARLAEETGIELICAEEIYGLLKEKDALPVKYLLEKPKSGMFSKIKGGFSRRLCMPAFWSGAAMLFFSYFSFYPVYYIVSGSLLLVLCSAAAIFGKRAK
ncbi:MAG TPA: hypothetical protein IAB42_03225, partial [Candidatus Coproplasma avistercoris]|nr:hypothetical protein [Candidatus Coproplasma avistercoris]